MPRSHCTVAGSRPGFHVPLTHDTTELFLQQSLGFCDFFWVWLLKMFLAPDSQISGNHFLEIRNNAWDIEYTRKTLALNECTNEQTQN